MLIIGTFILLAVRGLNYGIDFSGGILMEVSTTGTSDIAGFRDVLDKAGIKGASLQNIGSGNSILIRFQAKPDENQQEKINEVKSVLNANFPGLEYRKVDFVGPQVGGELAHRGFYAVAAAMIAIMVYLWFRFDWQFGLGGVIALFHDVIATIGFYAFTRLEFDLTTIAALLTIIGYSINDSVVIYDRIRENMRKYKKKSLPELINLSVNETLSRTVLTAGTVFVACLALGLFGGEVLKSFSFGMLFGIVVGTYSSVYISAPVLLYTNVRKTEMAEA